MDVPTVMPRLMSLLGLLTMMVLAWLISEDRRHMNWRLIIIGVLCQVVFALVILKTGPGRMVFAAVEAFVNGILACGEQGSIFLFGETYRDHYFAFSVLPLIKGKAAAQAIRTSSPLTFERITGWLFCPLAWIMGVDRGDVTLIGQILGEKVVLNEFVAYMDLVKLKAQLDPRSFTIATYAACGFANFGSVAIQIGGIGSMEPDRRDDIAQLSLRSMIGGTLAGFMTACIVGILM